MSVKKAYVVNKVRQLIDLNGDTVNFDVTFRVSSRDNQPFEALVIDQSTLDSTPVLPYKKAEDGQLSGNIVHDKNVYQNYYLILRSDTPCEYDVEIVKKELPKTTMVNAQPNQGNQGNNQSPQNLQKKTEDNRLTGIPGIVQENSFSWIKIAVIIGVILCAVAVYWYYNKDNEETGVTFGVNRRPSLNVSDHASAHASAHASDHASARSARSHTSPAGAGAGAVGGAGPDTGTTGNGNNKLLSRLKALRLY